MSQSTLTRSTASEDAMTSYDAADPANPANLRHVLSHVPTSVVVVTAMARGVPVGLTVGSFSSVSLDPPLVNFFIDLKSKTWLKLNEANTFTVNVLGKDHEHLCRAFSRPAADRFDGVDWTPSPSGDPVLREATVALECSRYKIDILGDHVQVVGRVRAMQAQAPDLPLVFYRGAFLEL
ncbi:flavin reductase family protein [Nocardioides sp. LHG3406-4]|uniref:flavin reductase family protein n=1 Tax=Nocardioides sp. LHG3406-4 TaxID=2804575 RepID=UPI003CF0AA6B